MALFEINEKSNVPIWVQLKNRLVYLITSEYYRPGDQLPTVRGLAADIGVNYNTVSKVYLSLEQDGFVESRRRQGTFVLDTSGKPGVTLAAMAKIAAQEYVDRCIELGLTPDDAERELAKYLAGLRGAECAASVADSAHQRS